MAWSIFRRFAPGQKKPSLTFHAAKNSYRTARGKYLLTIAA
jgi:hypothetical protein